MPALEKQLVEKNSIIGILLHEKVENPNNASITSEVSNGNIQWGINTLILRLLNSTHDEKQERVKIIATGDEVPCLMVFMKKDY